MWYESALLRKALRAFARAPRSPSPVCSRKVSAASSAPAALMRALGDAPT